jgi:hypothetical protein
MGAKNGMEIRDDASFKTTFRLKKCRMFGISKVSSDTSNSIPLISVPLNNANTEIQYEMQKIVEMTLCSFRWPKVMGKNKKNY